MKISFNFFQLFFAGIISAVYGLVMMAVLIGVFMQINDDGWLAPSSLFLICMAGQFVITAILHPQEFYCLKYGVIYYVTVPSMYMLLVIYSIFNMNNVSWGTREVTVVLKKKEELDAEVSEKWFERYHFNHFPLHRDKFKLSCYHFLKLIS